MGYGSDIHIILEILPIFGTLNKSVVQGEVAHFDG